jgi:hypothetical protein
MDYRHLPYGAVAPLGSSRDLITLTNPAPGTYTMGVRAMMPQATAAFTPATANLRIRTRVPTPLNFSAAQNSGGGTNTFTPSTAVTDGTRTFYSVTIPPTLSGQPPIGWKLSTATTQGTATILVYANPRDLVSHFAQTGERTLIVAPPFFVPGRNYIVEVRASGATSYTLTSEAITPHAWTVPAGTSAYTLSATEADSDALDLANGDYDFYAVTVPEGNGGILRTVIEAVSGNPDLYVRRATVPSRNHVQPTEYAETIGSPQATRQLIATTGTEYANWVPYVNRTETQLSPGTYYLAVHAAGNTNVRYRLRVSAGSVQTLALNGGSVTGQLLSGGDWRYYKFTVPTDGTAPQTWSLNFAQTSGDAMMFVRDTVPPGFSINSTVQPGYAQDYVMDWQRENKDGVVARYDRYDTPGTSTFDAPPLRPGKTYYVGLYAKTDSNFSLTSSTTGTLPAVTEIPYYTGALNNVSIPANSSVLYKMVAPADAGRLKFALTPSATIELAIEQGSIPTPTGTVHYRNESWTPTTGTLDQAFAGWPWIPGTTYYLRLSNPSASPVTFSLVSNSGRAGIFRTPAEVFALQGTTATLAMGAGGSPAPGFQWKRNDVNLTDGGRFSGSTTPTLTITDVQPSDHGSYQLTATNTTATVPFTATANTTLVVDGPPYEAVPPVNATASVGGSSGFSSRFYSVIVKTLGWQKSVDGGATWANLVTGGSVSIGAVDNGAYFTTINLSMGSIAAERSGEKYRAFAINAAGLTYGVPVTLLVQSPAAIITQPTEQSVTVGQPFTFSVVASGVPTPTYQWKFGTTNISGATNASYTKASAATTDAGNYSVVVTNSGATVTSTAVALTVNVPPAITTQPLGAALTMGQGHTMSVVATGTAPLSYQWKKGATALSGATNASFALTNVQLADAGDYSVVVANVASSVTSANATVSVSLAPAAPTVIGQPQNVVVNLGQAATFSVSASGVPTPTYQWQKGTTNITGATTASYTIAAVAAGDAGSYRVVVTNTQGTATSTAATLTVVLPPTIVTPPAAATVVVGQPATFAVTVAGTAPFTYQWRKNATVVSGATNATFTLAAVAAVDAGDYSVVVSNSAGVATTTAGTLTVNSPPAITTAPGNPTVVAGQVATLTLVATGNPAPSYQWQRQAAGTTGFVALANGGGYAGVTTATLAVTTTAAMHGDQFRAVASNGIGTAATSAAATLSVNAPPAITSAGAATFYIGQANAFTVAATGNPAPTFSVSAGALPAWATLNAATGVLTGTPPNNAGSPFTFTVAATNGIGSAGTQAFTLTVQAATLPTITAQPISRSAPVGASVNFAVTVVGTAPLSYQWRKNGTPISGATAATLTLSNVQTSDSAAYTVVITNVAGSVTSAVATLGVIPAGTSATHATVGTGYVAGNTVTITNTFTFTGGATSLAWRVLLPTGWSYLAGNAAQGDVKPDIGTLDLLEWAWSTPPTSPLTFTYTLNVPAGQTGPKQVVAVAVLRQGAAPIELLATPDPLVIDRVGTHSVDTNRDFRISLFELTRVIELYNTRNGSTRTGAYRVQDGTEDGFAPDPARTPGSVVALAKYHSGDSPPSGAGALPDGSMGLVELTRVIELYNTRSATVRTGAYHAQAGTEDGFASGP